MRVAIVCPYDLGRFGGVQDQALALATWLRGVGHQAVVIGPGEGPSGTVSVGRAVPVPANGSVAPVSLRPRHLKRLVVATAGADVVHIHEPMMPTVSLAATRLPDLPKVGTFHADPSPALRRLYRSAGPLARRIVGRLDVITAVSPVAASVVERLAPVRLVPNGIDVETYQPSPGVPKRVAFLGRDDLRKGLDVLLAAWPEVFAAIPDAELVVAAGERREEIEGVRFVTVPEGEKRTYLQDAAIYCAPNLGGESFGIVLVEGMAAGCAIVASALPAFAHVLGGAGVLTKPGEVTGLAGALIRVLGDEALCRQLQERSLERVGRYDRDAVLAGYLAAYRTAIEGAG
jgi:phosphatidylinositol alpha-mannosyltransferase